MALVAPVGLITLAATPSQEVGPRCGGGSGSRHVYSASPRAVEFAGDTYLEQPHVVPKAPVAVRIGHASLIELHRDHRMYQWRTVDSVPIGGAACSTQQTA